MPTKENVMSLDSSAHVRSGNRGFLSAGVLSIAAWVGLIAFTLVTLQGCAPSTVTASSAKEPSGVAIGGLGRIRRGEPTRSTTRETADRHVAERTHSAPLDRSFRRR